MTNIIQFPLEHTNYDIPQRILEDGRRVGLDDDFIRSTYRLAQELAADFRLQAEIEAVECEEREQREETRRAIDSYARDFKGENYEDHGRKDTAEIAKLIRADIKTAIKNGELPKGLKTSVRIERFSGGSSINVFIRDAGDTTIYSEEATHNLKEHGAIHTTYDPTHPDAIKEIYSPEYKAVVAKLEAIHGSYNFDKSNTMEDYFHVNYYGGVSLDYEYEDSVKEFLKS